MSLVARLSDKPVIAGIKDPRDVQTALERDVRVLFVLTGTVFQLREIQAAGRRGGALVFAHVDLIHGIAKDPCGMQLLAREVGVDGVLTTRTHLVKAAQEAGLLAIQRLFALDSEALKTGLSVLRGAKPDAVEILPALILPYIAHRLPARDLPPIIAGGLVETEAEVRAILKTPALAVSCSKKELWGLKARPPVRQVG